ncbi:MAG: Gfo/Idh/MocA family oxidoreductase [Chloroflexi bacterium]|nr:Gfo/Idh/MocA family oxidoreductase [Chloroflexota bacterium]
MSLGWAIVSTGRHPDTKMAPAINTASDSTIAAVVSRNIGRATAFADKHGAKAAYDDVDAMLRDPAVDVVYVASPNGLHVEHTLKAATAGKHVLVEKPMALSVDDCQRMIEACDNAGVKLGVGFHLRTHPGHRRVRDLVASGGVGKLSLTTANWGRGTRGVITPPPRAALQAWWDDPTMVGAGAFMATGVHCMDLMRFVTGREVTEVVALNDASAESPLEELLTLSARFDDGSLGTIMTGRRTPDYQGNDVMVYGSEGRAGVRDSIDMVLCGSLDVATEALTTNETFETDPIALYTWQVDAFNDAVERDVEPAASGLDGLRAAQVTLAMVESARTGRRVAIS